MQRLAAATQVQNPVVCYCAPVLSTASLLLHPPEHRLGVSGSTISPSWFKVWFRNVTGTDYACGGRVTGGHRSGLGSIAAKTWSNPWGRGREHGSSSLLQKPEHMQVRFPSWSTRAVHSGFVSGIMLYHCTTSSWLPGCTHCRLHICCRKLCGLHIYYGRSLTVQSVGHRGA